MSAQFQLLRAHVEKEQTLPAVILVTSAKYRDGKSLTAHTLAACIAQSGRRTAIVEAVPGDKAARGRHLGLLGAQAAAPASITSPLRGESLTREAVEVFLNDLRSSYEYSIIDAEPLLADAITMALAGSVDGVLLTVRLGRAPSDDDELTVRMIEQSRGRIIGVVATTSQAIAEFENDSRVREIPEPAQQLVYEEPARRKFALLKRTVVVLVASVAVAVCSAVALASTGHWAAAAEVMQPAGAAVEIVMRHLHH